MSPDKSIHICKNFCNSSFPILGRKARNNFEINLRYLLIADIIMENYSEQEEKLKNFPFPFQ